MTTHSHVQPEHNARTGPGMMAFIIAAIVVTFLGAALSAGSISANAEQNDACFGSGTSRTSAIADFNSNCTEPREDCDRVAGTWHCSDQNIDNQTPVVTEPTTAPSTEAPAPVVTAGGECLATASSLSDARAAYADNCTLPRADCDPINTGWVCSSEHLDGTGPNTTPTTVEPAPTTTEPTPVVPVEPTPTTEEPAPTTTEPTPTTAPPTTTEQVTPTTERPDADNCRANASGTADLRNDLIALHFDHAPDPDDGHATTAGATIAAALDFEPLVVGGTYGSGNASRYKDASEPLMDIVWGSNGWLNADANWSRSVAVSADRWVETLNACGDVWVAEGGQADFTADVVREVLDRIPGLDTESRIHVVQHSGWNENNSNSGDLAFVQSMTDYEKIDSGNKDNDTADLHSEFYRGPFLNAALTSENGEAWAAAFDFLSPSGHKLDFSDTTELLAIVGIGKDQIADVDEFADFFF